MLDFAAIRTRLFSVGQDLLNVAFDKVTGVMLAQLGDAVSGVTSANGAEIWQQPGLASRPTAAAPGNSASQCIVLHLGSRDIIIAQRDTRAANAFGNLNDGETVLYALGDGTGAARVKCGDDGAVTLFTTDTGAAGGKGVMLRLAPDGLSFSAPWGKLTLDRTGFHVAVDQGPALDMGVCGGLPPPFDSLVSSYFTVSGVGLAQLEAGHTLIGLPNSGYEPLTYCLAENPLTTPPVPIVTPIAGAPLGIVGSTSVSVAK